MNPYQGATGNVGNTATGRTKPKAPSGYKTFEQYTPEQMELFQNAFSFLGPDSYLARLAGGDQELFNQIEQPAMRQFQEMQSQTASKFSGMGMGARKSSGFQNTMNQATSDFASQLQAQRMSLQQQAIKDLMGMSNELLGQRPYGLVEKQNKPSFWQSVIGGGAPIVGAAAGGFFGGPAGAMAGLQAGQAAGQAFM